MAHQPTGLLLVVMVHSNDDIALLVALIDIAMGVGHLLERVTSIDDWSQLASFNQSSKVCQVFGYLAAGSMQNLLAACRSPARAKSL